MLKRGIGEPEGREGIPLVSGMTGNGDLMRLGSCISDPKSTALQCVLVGDLPGLTSLLAEECPVEDSGDRERCSDYPLPLDHWVNLPTGKDGGYRSLLHIAIEQGNTRIVSALVAAGARADLHSDDLGLSPAHVACSHNRIDMLQILLREKGNRANLGVRMRNGRTCLHIAAENNWPDLLEFLLSSGQIENIDAEDLMGRQTPLFLAVKKKNIQCVRVLLENGASLINTVDNRTIREYLDDLIPSFNPDTVTVKVKPKPSSERELLYSLAKILDKAQLNEVRGLSNQQNLVHFQAIIQAIAGTRKLIDSYSAGGSSLVQKCCDYNLPHFLHVLLSNGADPTATVEENTSRPVLIAAYNGNYKVLDVLFKHKTDSVDGVPVVRLDVQERGTKETALHYVLKKPRRGEVGRDEEMYNKCLDTLLLSTDIQIKKEVDKTINKKDQEGNTPLHYATQHWTQATVRRLLERGSNIGMQNKWGETPIDRILPETMEAFLDEFCLTSKNGPQHDDFEVKFRYSFLAPPVDNPYFDETDEEGQNLVASLGLPETESLWYMTQSKPHRHLLKHPVITSFLWMKWHRIRKYFNRNIRLYLMFVTILTWYIFERFGGISYRGYNTSSHYNSTLCSEEEVGKSPPGFWFSLFTIQAVLQVFLISRDWLRDIQDSGLKSLLQIIMTSWIEFFILVSIVLVFVFGAEVLFVLLTILLGLVAFREGLQMMVSLKRYIFDLENLLEVIVLALVTTILFMPDTNTEENCNLKRHLAAISIVVAWATLITLVGRHPKLARYNIYVTMFYKVLKSFIFFLTWYSFFIVAFGLGFYIMLHKDVPNHIQEEDEYKFFNNPWLSLVKTSTMFVGELEFSDIPIDTDTGLGAVSYLFFLSFIFLIVVVLMNLLNGLAVSDTGIIREEAEIVTYISRVETISCTEAVLLGDPFNFLSNWPAIRALRWMPTLALCRTLHKNNIIRDLSHKVTGATGILLFYTWLPTKQLIIQPNRSQSSCYCLAMEAMGAEVIQSAKNIVMRNQKESEVSDFEAKLNQMQKKQEDMAFTINSMADKIDIILAKLNTNSVKQT